MRAGLLRLQFFFFWYEADASDYAGGQGSILTPSERSTRNSASVTKSGGQFRISSSDIYSLSDLGKSHNLSDPQSLPV